MLLGPNSTIGNGPVLSGVEAQVDYILCLIDVYQTENIASFSPHADAVDDFIAHKDAFMPRSVWSVPCRSWYKRHCAEGPVTAIWPGSTRHYIEAMRGLKKQDWAMEYAGNRFALLENGSSQTEMDRRADWAYYIREADDGEPSNKAGRRKVIAKRGTKMMRKEEYDFSGKSAADCQPHG
ncbi:hypothetical protein VTO42DRAFT_2251 [Malbranchea cinnamomea]